MKFLPLFLLASLAFAQSASETTIESGTSEKKADKADELITNRRFRASTGSLSNWSIRTAWTYSAGSLDKPFAADRPLLDGNRDVALLQSLTGDVGVSYRVNTKNRLNLSMGLRMDAPFHNSIDDSVGESTKAQFNETQGELDANNPMLSYNHINKFFGVQTILTGSVTKYTAGNLTDRGYDYGLDASVNTIYDFGKSGLSAGLLGLATRNLFNDDSANLLAGQGETTLGLYPQLEYVINDTFNLRTIARAFVYQQSRAPGADFQKLDWTQSVGLGISVTRNLFLYPNIQFLPEDLRSDLTNIGLTANVNLF